MANSGRTIAGKNPFEVSGRTPGSLGYNDDADPNRAVCRASDTQGPLGSGYDLGATVVTSHLTIPPAAKNKSTEPGIELSQTLAEFKTKVITSGYVKFRIDLKATAKVNDAKSGKKFAIEQLLQQKMKITYESELGQLSDNVSVRIKGGFSPEALNEALTDSSKDLGTKLLESVDLQVGAKLKTGLSGVDEVTFDFVADKDLLPFRVTLTGKFPMPDLLRSSGISVAVLIQYDVRVNIGLTEAGWHAVMKKSGPALWNLLRVKAPDVLLALVTSPALPPTLLATASIAIPFAVLYLASSAQEQGEMVAACMDFAVSYSLTIYGPKTNYGADLNLKLQPTSDALALKFRNEGRDTAISHARALGAAISPGTPYSDSFLLELLGERRKAEYKFTSDAQACEQLYKDVFQEKKKAQGV